MFSIRRNANGYYDVLQDGNAVVFDESYGVACSIEEAGNGYHRNVTECMEVVDAILGRCVQQEQVAASA